MLFWYFLISLKATVPGLYRWGFLIPPEGAADLIALFMTVFSRGCLTPLVDLRAVVLVLAIFDCLGCFDCILRTALVFIVVSLIGSIRFAAFISSVA